jgi:hypothetical protein
MARFGMAWLLLRIGGRWRKVQAGRWGNILIAWGSRGLFLLTGFLIVLCGWGLNSCWADNYLIDMQAVADSVEGYDSHINSGPLPLMIPKGGGYLFNADVTAWARAEAGASAANRTGYLSTSIGVSVPPDRHGRFAFSRVHFLEDILVLTPQNLLFEFNIRASGAKPLNLMMRLDSDKNLFTDGQDPAKFTARKIGHWVHVVPNMYILSLLGQIATFNGPEDVLNSQLDIDYKWHKAGECFEDNFFTDGSKCGVQVKVCNYDDGIRVIRYKTANSPAIVGRCHYAPGGNDNPLWFDESYYTVEGKYRWINYKLNKDFPKDFTKALQVDVYTYDPCHNNQGGSGENLEARSYKSFQDFKDDIDPSTHELKGQKGPPWYDKPPPSNAADLIPPDLSAAGLLSAETSQSASRLDSQVAADPEEVDICYSPGCALCCLKNTEDKWYYGLIPSEAVGGLVAVGDTIKIEGPGIVGGSVEGNAATAAYGAWRLKESSSGRVVFQALSAAVFSGIADNFVVLAGPGAVAGQVTYNATGNWIGSGGMVQGPSRKNKGMPWLLLLLDD